MFCNRTRRFTKYIRKDIIEFQIGYSKTILGTILFTVNHTGEFETVSYEVPKFSDVSRWNKGRFNHEIIRAISDVSGVVDYNVEDSGVWYSAGVDFDYLPTAWNLSITSYGGTGEYIACLSSEKCSAFESGKYTLVDGRHLTPDDNYAILISQELAEYNGLSVGDTVEMYSLDLDYQGYDPIVEVKIVGIFNGTEGTSTGNEMTADQLEANCGFIAYNTVFDTFKDLDVEYVSLTIYVEDPTSIQNVYDEIADLPEIKGKTLKLTIDTDEYEVVQTPLESLQSLVNTAIMIIGIVSLFVLTLLLTLWIRGRKKEIGIYLSVGKSKPGIIGQFFTETAAVAVLAFASSIFFSRFIAERAGRFLVSRISTGAELTVQVSPEYLLPVYLIGMGIVVIAVIAASWTVIRLKPRDILTKVS